MNDGVLDMMCSLGASPRELDHFIIAPCAWDGHDEKFSQILETPMMTPVVLCHGDILLHIGIRYAVQ